MLSLSETQEDNFRVVAEFGTKEPDPEYIIIYQDREGIWGNAVGKWNDSISVASSYNNEGIAIKMAETLFKIFNNPVRVITEQDK